MRFDKNVDVEVKRACKEYMQDAFALKPAIL